MHPTLRPSSFILGDWPQQQDLGQGRVSTVQTSLATAESCPGERLCNREVRDAMTEAPCPPASLEVSLWGAAAATATRPSSDPLRRVDITRERQSPQLPGPALSRIMTPSSQQCPDSRPLLPVLPAAWTAEEMWPVAQPLPSEPPGQSP